MDLLGNRRDRRVDSYFLRAEYEPIKKIKVVPYIAYRNDRSNQWSRPLFIGIHSSGEISKRMDYWAEFAWVKGEEKTDGVSNGTFDFEGIGFDVGTIYEFDSPIKPSIITGFAFGSGDNTPDDDLDKGFRQTGLHDNSDKLAGVTSVNYYGELFDPELSNLMVFTIGTGIKPQESLSLEAIYHYYLQDQKDDEIRDASVDADPTGLSRDLGSEIDFVIGWRHSKKLDLKASFGMFLPGDAFSDQTDDTAYLAILKLKYKF
jgi:alginate production protein